jgi:hypothetical protein
LLGGAPGIRPCFDLSIDASLTRAALAALRGIIVRQQFQGGGPRSSRC